MQTLSAVLITIALLMIFEGLFFLLAPKQSQRIARMLAKSSTHLRRVGYLEILIAVILIIIAILLVR